MKSREKGFTLVETIIAVGIMALASGAAGTAIYQTLKNNERNGDHLTVARQVELAGEWISRDTQMAMSVTANLTPPAFLTMTWTTNVTSSTANVTHKVDYSVENVTGGVGSLKRHYTNTAGIDQQAFVADKIYYYPSDAATSSNTSYQNPVLTVKLTSRVRGALEIKQYIIRRRPNTQG